MQEWYWKLNMDSVEEDQEFLIMAVKCKLTESENTSSTSQGFFCFCFCFLFFILIPVRTRSSFLGKKITTPSIWLSSLFLKLELLPPRFVPVNLKKEAVLNINSDNILGFKTMTLRKFYFKLNTKNGSVLVWGGSFGISSPLSALHHSQWGLKIFRPNHKFEEKILQAQLKAIHLYTRSVHVYCLYCVYCVLERSCHYK